MWIELWIIIMRSHGVISHQTEDGLSSSNWLRWDLDYIYIHLSLNYSGVIKCVSIDWTKGSEYSYLSLANHFFESTTDSLTMHSIFFQTVMESTTIATIHYPDVGYYLFGIPLITHIPYHVSCTFSIVIISYWVVLSFARLIIPLAPCTQLGYSTLSTMYY